MSIYISGRESGPDSFRTRANPGEPCKPARFRFAYDRLSIDLEPGMGIDERLLPLGNPYAETGMNPFQSKHCLRCKRLHEARGPRDMKIHHLHGPYNQWDWY